MPKWNNDGGNGLNLYLNIASWARAQNEIMPLSHVANEIETRVLCGNNNKTYNVTDAFGQCFGKWKEMSVQVRETI